MSKKTIALLFLLIASPVIIYFVWPTEESRIRKLVRQGAHAVEAGNVEEVMKRISYNYSDEYGMSYLLLKKSLEDRLKVYTDINVTYSQLAITVRDEEAEATMDLRVIATRGGVRGYYLGDLGEPAVLSLMLKKGGPLNRWQVVRASGYLMR